MTQFWTITKGKVTGPYDPKSLIKTEGFSAKTSVYQEGDKFWRSAREFGVFRQYFSTPQGSVSRNLPPVKTIITGDMIYPDYNVLPRTWHSEGLTSVGTDTAKIRWAVPVVYKKTISVVAGLMTAAVLVHGNPMRWLPQAWRLGGPPKQAQ